MDRSGGIWLMPTKDWIPDILLLLHCILDERVRQRTRQTRRRWNH